MYEQYYGFKERPFQLTPSPGLFYASKLHKRALAYLQYGLSQGEGFIVITGDIGTGKTTIANQLLNQLNQDEIVARQIVTSKLDPDDLIRMIATSFNLMVNEHTKAGYLDAIYTYLKRLHAQRRRALLLVDEAQNLPLNSIEELRMLSNFQLHGRPLLQSFLLGQNELNAIIQAPDMEQFRQRIIASSNLTPFQEEDTKAYITYRLHQAGLTTPLMNEECFPLIQQFSRGIPRKINTLMDRVLLFGYLEERSSINQEDIRTILEEMSQEVANIIQTQPVKKAEETAAAEPEGYHSKLAELTALLDNTLEQKIRMAKELDSILQRQQKLLGKHKL